MPTITEQHIPEYSSNFQLLIQLEIPFLPTIWEDTQKQVN